MKILYAPHFERSYKFLPKEIKRKFRKQVNYLLQNLRHPSLRTKKYNERHDIWQARVNRNYRFYFLIRGDIYILLDIKLHPE